MVALSHPLLRPNSSPQVIRKYSQQYIAVIDITKNQFVTLPIHDVLDTDYTDLRYVAQLDQEDFFSSLRSSVIEGDKTSLRVTLEDLLKRTPFAERMRTILRILEQQYDGPVDMEFTARVVDQGSAKPETEIVILQCRPQSRLDTAAKVAIPGDLQEEETVFSVQSMVPQGIVRGIEYVLYVPAEAYFALKSPEARSRLERSIGKLNNALLGKVYIAIGPGRWGTTNPDLGVGVGYGDIYNTRALIEVTGQEFGQPEPCYGTHFFQDLMESQIYPMAIMLDEPTTVFNHSFFYDTPNRVTDWLAVDDEIATCLKLINVQDYSADQTVTLVMDDDRSAAAAFFEPRKLLPPIEKPPTMRNATPGEEQPRETFVF
jgi:hypothetical protein